MTYVHFSDPDEFLVELREQLDSECAHDESIELVRSTMLYQESPQYPGAVQHVFYIAGFLGRDGRLCELYHYVGDRMHGDERAEKKGQVAKQKVETAVLEFGLPIRAGRYQFLQPPRPAAR